MEEQIVKIDQWMLIQYLGGFGIVLTGIFTLASKLILNKLQIRWEAKSNHAIEILKGEIAKNNSILTTLTNHVGNGFQKIMDKRVEATELIWNQTLNIQKNIPSTVEVLYQILQKDEFNNKFIDSGNQDMGKGLLEVNIPRFVLNSSDIRDEAWVYRPFMSENLWTLIIAFHAFTGRLVFLLVDGYQKENIKYWLDEKGVNEIMNTVFSKEEISFLKNERAHSYKRL